jgi:hypothetical protein
MPPAGVEQVTGDRAKARRRRRGGVDVAELREACQVKLAALRLELPVPFSLEAFCEVLGARLGRQIVLCPVDTRTGPCGLWVALPEAHLFFYERVTSPLHQEQIVCHEAGHAVFEDDAANVLDEEELAGLLGLDPVMVRRVLGRTSYDDEVEQRAEVFGTMIVEQAVHAPAAPPSTDAAAVEVLHRVQAALTGSDAPPHGR